MRAYDIKIMNGDTVFRQYNTFNSDGTFNPNSLMVDLDIFSYAQAQPASLSSVKVWGISLQDLSTNFSGMSVLVSAGMTKGLPLANEKQYGLISQGNIFQFFGNWQGIEQNLTFIFNANTGLSPSDTINLSFDWKKGQDLSISLKNTLQIAFPNATINMNISKNLVLNSDQPGSYTSLAAFSQYINALSQAIIGKGYLGVNIVISSNVINVYDGTTKSQPKTIVFTDLIGQPTWQDIATLQLQLVMRYDLNVGDYIQLPNLVTTNTANSLANFRSNSVFQGTFLITGIRHVGNNRDINATSWCTIVTCVSLNPTGN